VINLDTYQVEVIYNPEQLIYLNTYENSPFENIQNLLETNHGQLKGGIRSRQKVQFSL